MRDLLGKLVEVTVNLRVAGREEPVELVDFGGAVDRLQPTPSSSTTRWRLWLGEDPLVVGRGTLARLDQELFKSAEVVADVPPVDERAERGGLTWTLLIQQGGTISTYSPTHRSQHLCVRECAEARP